MKAFKFKLEVVLRVRKIKEEETLRNLAASQKAYQAHVQQKQALLDGISKALKEKEDLAKSEISAVTYQTFDAFIRGSKHRLVHCERNIVRASRSVDKSMRAYLVAKRRTRAIEILQEKGLAEYRKAKVKYEQKNQDDLVLMRARLREGELE